MKYYTRTLSLFLFISVLVGQPTFTESAISISADYATGVYIADVDGDGDMDVLSSSANNDKIAWYENDGSESFTEDVISDSANSARDVYAADVDGDGDMDVLSASANDSKIAWYENDGSQNFTEHVISDSASAVDKIDAADVDGDGDMDVLSASYGDDKIAWYENDGSGSFTEHAVSTSADGARGVYAADLDGDGDMDMLSANYNEAKVAWYENDGSESFTEHIISTSASQAKSVYAADVNGDGYMDVLSASIADDKIAWYENDGSEGFTEHIISIYANGAHDVQAVDVDGDGDMDAISVSLSDDKVAWYENNGSESFTEHIISNSADGAWSIYAGDVDGDGDMDVLSASYGDDKIAWYEQEGSPNTYVPDDNFEQALIDLGYDDVLDNYVVTDSISGVTDLDVSNDSISDLTGIENFTALTTLHCSNNQLTTLDVSNNTALTSLGCGNNLLTELDVSNNTALWNLQPYGNQLTALDVSNHTALEKLRCHDNELTSLNLTGATALYEVFCYNNQLTALDVSTNTALEDLLCDRNQLTTLDVSNNTYLTRLHCYTNSLTSLSVSGAAALTALWCYNNQLTALDVSTNTALTHLYCYNNELTELDVSGISTLTHLECGGNQLTSLDVNANTALTSLGCPLNQLTTLDVSNNTALENLQPYGNQLTSLDVSNNTVLGKLRCHDNQLTILDMSANTDLYDLYCKDNDLTYLNMKNGVTDQLTNFNATSNPNLTCIETLDPNYATANWTYTNGNIDDGVLFSESCIDISVSPDSLSQQLESGMTATQTLTITNDGLSDLVWSISSGSQSNSSIIINEVNLGSDDWVELYNNTSDPIDMEGWTLGCSRYVSSYVVDNFVLTSFTIEPYSYFVLPEGSNTNPNQYGIGNINWGASPVFISVSGWLIDPSGNGIDYFRAGENSGGETPPEGAYWDDNNVVVPLPSDANTNGISRVPDLSDTDSSIDWALQPHTEGYSNDEAVIPNQLRSNLINYDEDLDNSYLEDLDNSYSNNTGMRVEEYLANIRSRQSWLSIDSTSGTIPGGSYQDVQVTFDATALDSGSYSTNISIYSNDMNFTVLDVPVSLEVIPPYQGPWYVAPTGSDSTGDGKEANPFATIQTAIDTSIDGDSVLVAAGTYVENINFNGKNISVIGDDRETTIIDGDSSGSVVVMDSGEDSTTVLSGFTITNGLPTGAWPASRGGGINCQQASPTLSNLLITGNSSTAGGGGIYLYNGSDAKITDVIIKENIGGWGGGGMYIEGSDAELTNVHIHSNDDGGVKLQNADVSFNYVTISDNESYGMHIEYSEPTFNHVTIVNNDTYGVGLYSTWSHPVFTNSIIANNGTQVTTNQSTGPYGISVSYSNIQGGLDELDSLEFDPDSVNWNSGNIDANPLFCEPDSNNYHLSENSPCVGTGENNVNMGALGIGCELLDIELPSIISIEDVPNDQGNWVYIQFTSSVHDASDEGPLGSYTIERYDGREWVSLHSIDAYGADYYTTEAHTLMDSTAESNGMTTYRVVAAMEVGAIISASASGYSIDNIAPGVPTGLMATISEAGIHLRWDLSTADDFQYFDLEKSSTAEFSNYQSIETADTAYLDTEYEINVPVYYRLIAYDDAGNPSEYSVTVDAAVLWTDLGIAIPDEFAIHQNYPNPFNPVTTLRYDLPEQTHVNITVYDMLGRKVRTFLNQQQDPGYKSLIWDATNDYGKPVSAGIYLYRIQAGEYISTKKMVLLK